MKIDLSSVPVESGSTYPAAFQKAVEGRSRQRIGKAAGLKNFGVNLTTLQPGSQSALRHWHSAQDEFIYVVQGKLMLVTDEGEQLLKPGDMACFAAARANGHHLINRASVPATYLEIGDKSMPDRGEYPDDDLVCVPVPTGQRRFEHKDGTPYEDES